MHDELTTWEAYRYAGRHLKWKVYRFFRLVWIAAVVCLALALPIPGIVDPSYAGLAMAVAIVSAILHSGSQTLTMPWLTLKAVVLGALVYGICVLVQRYTAFDLHGSWVAVVAGTAQLLKDSDLARMKLANPDL